MGIDYLKRLLASAIMLLAANASFGQIDKDYFMNKGRQNLIDGQYSIAITDFNTVIKVDNKQHQAFFFRGIAKYNLGDLIGAAQDFTESIHINPVFTQAYHYRAIAQARMGNTENALSDLNTASLLRPEYPGIYYTRGVTLFMSKQFEKAIEDYNRYIKSEPKESEVYINRGTAYLFLKDTTQALTDYNHAILLDRTNKDGYLRRGRVYSLQKKMKEALDDFNKTIELDSTNAEAYFSRGIAYYDMKRYNNTMSDFNRAIELEPSNPLMLYNRALLRAQVGDLNNALEDYNEVAKITPKNVLVYYNRAAVKIELGMFKESIKDYSKAIELYPDFANAYMNRSYVKRQLNDLKGSKRDYEFAQAKIKEYRSRLNDSTFSIYADTSKKFNAMMSFDTNIEDEDVLLDREVDIKLRPLFKIEAEQLDTLPQPQRAYFYPQYDKFRNSIDGLSLTLTNEPKKYSNDELSVLMKDIAKIADDKNGVKKMLEGIVDGRQNQFAKATAAYSQSLKENPSNGFAYINRSAIQAEMVDFAASIDNTIQPMLLDERGPVGGNRKVEVTVYNYDEALSDLFEALKYLPKFAYIFYNMGNIYTQANRMPEAIDAYTKAIDEYPYLSDAYYNRGMIQIYLKDVNKGCLDISKAGELGIQEAYKILKRYCIKGN